MDSKIYVKITLKIFSHQIFVCLSRLESEYFEIFYYQYFLLMT